MGKDCCKKECKDYDRRECKEFRVKNFPDSIRELLCLLAKDDENRVTAILKNTCEDCILEDACLVAVIGDLAVFRYHDKFKFVDMDCICSIIVDCETILDELLESSNQCKC
ncbi:hypothetical protein SDC9_170770 [bioreactor metagenome]|uniref:Uncharacterized protein n=1 Tax=bioreactor metagenome TaxID=1076179 RepID=A0A645GBL7_9ZZZZ|nr:hypothetical protein [Lutispora sp.]MEA4960689.1 hypothetical protein [Lutispora sp.]HCJ58991.1 hypothetical protein [Clostridiaceae bacterium]